MMNISQMPYWALPNVVDFLMSPPQGQKRKVDADSMRGRRVLIDGVLYEDTIIAAEALSMPHATICYWLRTGKATRVR